MNEPDWEKIKYPKLDFDSINYYSAPKNAPKFESLDEVDPQLLETYKQLCIPLDE